MSGPEVPRGEGRVREPQRNGRDSEAPGDPRVAGRLPVPGIGPTDRGGPPGGSGANEDGGRADGGDGSRREMDLPPDTMVVTRERRVSWREFGAEVCGWWWRIGE